MPSSFPCCAISSPPDEYDAMAEEFENKEHELFGEDGFEKMTTRIAELERQMGINQRSQSVHAALKRMTRAVQQTDLEVMRPVPFVEG